MIKKIFFVVSVILIIGVVFTVRWLKIYKNSIITEYNAHQHATDGCSPINEGMWKIQAIDTMKYSRDHADIHMKDERFMNTMINKQVADIATTGATHIAIDTPYDQEFRPMLTRWVEEARKNNLKVLFRGNWSSWEGWFNYPKNLTRGDHIKKTKQFILDNPDLFQDGDVFMSCPECENGGPGDPRKNKDTEAYRDFLIKEYNFSQDAFKTINKKVDISKISMNGDVAELIMDKKTTQVLGGYITVDHYVKTPERLDSTLRKYAKKSGGKIFVGELGVPLDSMHGYMSEDQQAKWLDKAFKLLMNNKNVIGFNYWVNMEGSTAIWNKDNSPRKAVGILEKYFKPRIVYGQIIDEFDQGINGAKVVIDDNVFYSNENGCYSAKFISDKNKSSVIIQSDNFIGDNFTIDNSVDHKNVLLIAKNKDWNYKIKLWLYKKFKK